MRVNFYKPNSQNTGHAISFRAQEFNGKPCLMLEIVKQFSWDSAKRVGSFAGNVKDATKKCCIKLETTEVGSLINTLKRHQPSSFFHKNGDSSSSISLKVYDKKVKDGEAPQKALSLSIKKGDALFGVGLELSEGEVLLVFLQKYLSEKAFVDSFATEAPASE